MKLTSCKLTLLENDWFQVQGKEVQLGFVYPSLQAASILNSMAAT